jgi:uncharacterized protein YbjQ (UPF0145 family)
MLVTTTPGIEGRTVSEYLGVVTAQGVLGVNVFKDVGAGVRNIFGGRSKSYENELASGVSDALAEMEQQAAHLVGPCQVGAGGRPVRRSHRGAGRLHSGQAPAQQASRTCSSPSSCHKVRPTPPVLGVAAVPESESRARPRPG